jgi:N-acetylglucosamine repressor
MLHLKKSRHRQLTSVNAKIGRNINRSIVLNAVREKQPISRAAISTITGLNKSTVSNIVLSLLEEDLVKEDLDRNRKVGRNPINLRIKEGKHYVGAIYFESAKTVIAVVDIDGTIKSRVEIKTELDRPKVFVSQCIEELNKLRNKLDSHNFLGIGVTVAGIVDSMQSKVIYAPNLGWDNVDLGQIFRNSAPGIELITIENDAKASALAELLLGKHGTIPNSIVFLSVGYGIGTGIVLDNHILSGSCHAAGEFGHMIIVEGGELCSCGNQGCWEVYASDRATVRRYATSKGLPPDQANRLLITNVIDAAKKGELIATEVLSKTGHYMGLGIANIIRSFDPEVIIIGGSVTQAWDIVYPEIMETVNNRGFFGKHQNTSILPTSLSDSPPLLGAAALSIRNIFTDHRIAI